MRRDWQIMALLAAATIAVFWRVSWHEFVNYDDPAYVTHNPMVQAGLTWPGVKWAFGELHGEATYWHPLTWLSHMLDCQLFGLRPGWHHLTGLLLHTANVILLFLLLQRLTGGAWRGRPKAEGDRGAQTAEDASRFTFRASRIAAWRSFFVAALFALHPLQVDSVAWVAERKNVLSTLFGLLCLWAYVRYAEKSVVSSQGSVISSDRTAEEGSREKSEVRGQRSESGSERTRDRASRFTHHVSLFYLLSLFFFALGLMSKPMLVPLPLVMLLLDYWPLRRLDHGLLTTEHAPRSTLRRLQLTTHNSRLKTLSALLLEKVPFLAFSAASSLVTLRGHESLGALVSAQELPLAYRLANAVVAYAIYLRKVVWPVDLSVFYLHPGRWPAWAVIGSAALLLGMTVLAVWQARRRPYLIVGWLWFLGMLVPTIGLVQAHVQALADRFVYMPIIGVFVMGVWAAADWMETWPARRAVPAGLAALAVAGCGMMSTLQLRHWRDSISLLQHAVDVEGNNFIARVMLGNAFFERGQFDPALREYQAAARLRPDYAEAWEHAGMVLTQQGKPGEAVPYFRTSIELAPGWPEPQRRLALALLRQGRKEEAQAAYQQLVQMMPATAEGYRDLADMLNEGQQFAEAIHYYREALRLEPDFPPVLNNLALLRAACEQPEFRDGPEAVQLAERACRLTRRRDANLLGTLAAAYAQAGRFGEAVKTIKEAQALAKASGADYLLPIQAEMLEKFRAGKPFR